MLVRYFFVVLTGQSKNYLDLYFVRCRKQLKFLRKLLIYYYNLIKVLGVFNVLILLISYLKSGKTKFGSVFRYYKGIGDFIVHNLLCVMLCVLIYLKGGDFFTYLGSYFYYLYDPFMNQGFLVEFQSIELLAKEVLGELDLGSDEMITEYRPYVVSIVFAQIMAYLVLFVLWSRSLRNVLSVIGKHIILLYLVVYYWYIVNECQMLPSVLKYLIYAPQVFEI